MGAGLKIAHCVAESGNTFDQADSTATNCFLLSPKGLIPNEMAFYLSQEMQTQPARGIATNWQDAYPHLICFSQPPKDHHQFDFFPLWHEETHQENQGSLRPGVVESMVTKFSSTLCARLLWPFWLCFCQDFQSSVNDSAIGFHGIWVTLNPLDCFKKLNPFVSLCLSFFNRLSLLPVTFYQRRKEEAVPAHSELLLLLTSQQGVPGDQPVLFAEVLELLFS